MAASVLPTAVGPTRRINGGFAIRDSPHPLPIGYRVSYCILEMRDLCLAVHLLNCDYINLPMVDPVVLGVISGAGYHVLLFARRDGNLWWAERTGSAGFNLDKYRKTLFLCDQINLAVGCANVARDNLIAFGG